MRCRAHNPIVHLGRPEERGLLIYCSNVRGRRKMSLVVLHAQIPLEREEFSRLQLEPSSFWPRGSPLSRCKDRIIGCAMVIRALQEKEVAARQRSYEDRVAGQNKREHAEHDGLYSALSPLKACFSCRGHAEFGQRGIEEVTAVLSPLALVPGAEKQLNNRSSDVLSLQAEIALSPTADQVLQCNSLCVVVSGLHLDSFRPTSLQCFLEKEEKRKEKLRGAPATVDPLLDMILEICQLKVKPHLTPSDPSLLVALAKARAQLREKVHDTNSRFYQCIEDPSLIYILGVWPTLALHHEFLASPRKSEILDSQEDLFDFGWVLHLDIGEEGMDELPLDAPVMAIARLFVEDSDEHVRGYDDAVREYRRVVGDGTRPWKVANGWRVDCDDGKKEAVMISGWEGIDAHLAFAAKMNNYPTYDVKHGDFGGIFIEAGLVMRYGTESNWPASPNGHSSCQIRWTKIRPLAVKGTGQILSGHAHTLDESSVAGSAGTDVWDNLSNHMSDLAVTDVIANN
ncbi:unnamed protein product [Diplocarpon coronariae]